MTQPTLIVRQVMQPDPVCVAPGQTVQEALALMNGFRVGALLVVGPGPELQGIFTERDLLRRVSDAGPGWRDRTVSEWMTTVPHTIAPDVQWEDAVAAMERLKVRHLPVVEGGRPVGIISARLLMAWQGHVLSSQVDARTRELRASNEELMARDAELRYNLRAAGRLQNRLLLPHARPDWPEVRWGVHFVPLDHLGGDYYDFALPDPDHLGVLIADASGHSIAAALVAIMCRFAFTEVAGRTIGPGEVLSAVNERLQGLTEDRFVTAFYGVLNRRTRELTYANAGHPYPLHYSTRTGDVRPLAARGFLLGIMPGEQYREKTVTLEPGDRICFFTDGMVEARDEIGEAFGTDRLTDGVRAFATEPADAMANRLVAGLNEFRGAAPLTDDVTLLVAEVRDE